MELRNSASQGGCDTLYLHSLLSIGGIGDAGASPVALLQLPNRCDARMDILSIVKSEFGLNVAEYLQNKNRGGVSGSKGLDYENKFATFKLAEHAIILLTHSIDCKFSPQHLGFADDLVIFNSDIDAHYFQLKNSVSVSWNKKPHPLYLDFEYQYMLSSILGIKRISCQLVISDMKSTKKLHRLMPRSIAEFSSVFYFPEVNGIHELRLKMPEFNECIKGLCAFPHEDDKLDAVAIVLNAAWCNAAPSGSASIKVSELLGAAKRIQPSYIRWVVNPIPLNDKAKKVLENIENFSYSTDNGFFSWSWCDGLESGTLAYDCSDPRFASFQQILIRSSPSQFSELEGLLL